MDEWLNIDKNTPTNDDLKNYDNSHDLVKLNKFPVFPETQLHVIIGVNEDKLITYDNLREPASRFKPFLARCPLGGIWHW